MLMLTGEANNPAMVRRVQELGWGRMYVLLEPKPYPGEPWGFDNGAYLDWRRGRGFDGDAYLQRLERAYSVGRPYLAVVPDIVAGGLRSLEFSLGWLNRLPGDWPWYLAVQDGMALEDVEDVLDGFTGLFLGGSDGFKGTAYWWAELAHRYGKRFHYGRASTTNRLHEALRVGADSCDSAFWLWSKHRMRAVLRALEIQQGTFWPPEVTAAMPRRCEDGMAL